MKRNLRISQCNFTSFNETNSVFWICSKSVAIVIAVDTSLSIPDL